MNREIKFRGKTINDGKWVYGSLLQSETDTNGNCRCAIVQRFADEYAILKRDVIPETVGEFTGIMDKNEKEIYEGDLVYDGVDRTSGVFYRDGSFMTYISDGGSYLEISQNSFKHHFEVVGNIPESKTENASS